MASNAFAATGRERLGDRGDGSARDVDAGDRGAVAECGRVRRWCRRRIRSVPRATPLTRLSGRPESGRATGRLRPSQHGSGYDEPPPSRRRGPRPSFESHLSKSRAGRHVSKSQVACSSLHLARLGVTSTRARSLGRSPRRVACSIADSGAAGDRDSTSSIIAARSETKPQSAPQPRLAW